MENKKELTEIEKETKKLEIESNLQKLIERRNTLKDSNQLNDDIATLLNKGIIINMLELCDIKNEAVTMNLLYAYNDIINESEHLWYDDKQKELGTTNGAGNYLKINAYGERIVVKANKSKDKAKKIYVYDECIVSKDDYDNTQLMFRKTKISINSDNIQIYLFNKDNFLVGEVSDYLVGDNFRTLFEPCRIKEYKIYKDNQYEIFDILYEGSKDFYYKGDENFTYSAKTTKPEKIIQTKEYSNGFERILPKNRIDTNIMTDDKFKKNMEKISPELYQKGVYLQSIIDEKNGVENNGPKL